MSLHVSFFLDLGFDSRHQAIRDLLVSFDDSAEVAAAAADPEDGAQAGSMPPRKVGRPLGSKNKKPTMLSSSFKGGTGKPRGRPPKDKAKRAAYGQFCRWGLWEGGTGGWGRAEPVGQKEQDGGIDAVVCPNHVHDRRTRVRYFCCGVVLLLVWWVVLLLMLL